MEMILRRMKIDGVTVHGFRSSFRDWCGEVSTFPREVAEAALAHVAGDQTERAYRRGDALEKRRALMEAWATYCEPKEGSWGGRRKGAGRKPKLTLSSRRKIASDYLARMQDPREFGDTPRREAVIGDLMAEFVTTPRMVRRCLDEQLARTRWNTKMYKFATEGASIQRLPKEKIEKLSLGTYEDKNLRLIIDPAGNRTWIFRFIWRSTGHEMILGGSELSLATARELATKASRKLAAGQNPIDGSWSSSALQSLRSKS